MSHPDSNYHRALTANRKLLEQIATLQAENERLRLVAQDNKAETEATRLQNERLRKAGDGLMFEGETMAHEVSWNPAPWDRVVAAWVAAKEGGAK